MCRSQGLEVGEGTASTNAEPFCQIRSCTVASTRASFKRTIHPDLARVDEPVPPVAHRRRGHPMPTCCLGQRQLALQHGQHDLELLVHRHLP
jgi:hypothetical protein